MSKAFVVLVTVVAVGGVAASIALQTSSSSDATGTVRNVALVDVRDGLDLDAIGLELADRVASLDALPEGAQIIVFDGDSQAAAASGLDVLHAALTDGVAVVALNVTLHDLTDRLEIEALKTRLGVAGLGPIPQKASDGDFFSFVSIGYAGGDRIQYSGAGQQLVSNLPFQLERLSRMPAEYEWLRAEQEAR